MSALRHKLRAWLLCAGVTATALAVSSRAEAPLARTALAVAAGAAWGATALALDLPLRRLALGAPAALAVLLHGAPGALVAGSATALVMLARLRGAAPGDPPRFVTLRLHARRVMDTDVPGPDAHRALSEGFAGPAEELRAAVAPVATLPPSVALPVLARLSLHTDSVTRLTARKRYDLMLSAMREEGESPTPERDARHAALRIRKAETLLTLADLAASDADERKRLLTLAAALATVAASDFPGNPHYAATAAGAAARVGELGAARRLLARVTDPRRAWSTGRVVRLCERMMPGRRAPGSTEAVA